MYKRSFVAIMAHDLPYACGIQKSQGGEKGLSYGYDITLMKA